MPNEWVIVAVPTVLIVIGIVLNWSEGRSLRAELNSLRGELRGEIVTLRGELMGRFNVLESDMRQFYHLSGKMEARVDAVEKKVGL